MSKNLAILAIALLSLSGASFTDASAQLTGPCLGNHLRALRITIGTGDDDLRGGTDNVMLYAQALRRPDWVLIPLRGGLNANARWADRSTHSIDVAIPITGSCPPPPAYITGLRLQTTFRGGTGGDN